jgi:hypothetical protein
MCQSSSKIKANTEPAFFIPTVRNRFAGVLGANLAGCYSICTRQIRFVDLHPAYPAAPVAVRRRFARRHIIERAGGNNHTLAIARGVRNRAIAVAADLPREAFRLREIETFDQILPPGPAKLSDGHGDVRGANSTSGFAATRAVAMPKPSERRAHLVAHRLTETASSNGLFGHRTSLEMYSNNKAA